MYDVIIVGGGPGGLTSGIYASRANMKTLLIRSAFKPSLITTTDLIENYPGFPEGIGGFELVERFTQQALRFGTEIMDDDLSTIAATRVDGHAGWQMSTSSGEFKTLSVILSTGTEYAHLNVPGEAEFTGRGVSYCATCDGPLFRGAEVAVSGHSEEAAEDVRALHEMGCRVHWIPGGRGEDRARAQAEEFAGKGIRIHFDSEIREIAGDTRVEKIVLGKGGVVEELSVAAVFIFRETPTAPFFSRAGITLDRGTCIAVDRFQKTNLPGVFAAGDVTCGGLQIASAVGEGCVAALQALIHIRR